MEQSKEIKMLRTTLERNMKIIANKMTYTKFEEKYQFQKPVTPYDFFNFDTRLATDDELRKDMVILCKYTSDCC